MLDRSASNAHSCSGGASNPYQYSSGTPAAMSCRANATADTEPALLACVSAYRVGRVIASSSVNGRCFQTSPILPA